MGKNHKLSCIEQNGGKFILSGSVEMIQQNLKEGYATDNETKKILDVELNKRNKIHKQKKQQQSKTILMIMIAVISIYVAIYTTSRFTTKSPRINPTAKTKNPLPNVIFINEQPQNQNKKIISQRQETKNPQHQQAREHSNRSDRNKNKISNHIKNSPGNTSTKEATNKFQPDSGEDQAKNSSDHKESKPMNASAKYNKWDNHTEEFLKHLVSSLEASLSSGPKDIEIHIISTVNSSCPEPAIQHNKCGSCNGPPLHAFKGNSQLDL